MGGKPGTMRALTSIKGQDELEAIVGHDPSRQVVIRTASKLWDVLDFEY